MLVIAMDEATFNKIIIDIRNMRKLTDEEIQSIKYMSIAQLKELILLYNYLIGYMSNYINNDCK